jgi:hypothetical protein
MKLIILAVTAFTLWMWYGNYKRQMEVATPPPAPVEDTTEISATEHRLARLKEYRQKEMQLELEMAEARDKRSQEGTRKAILAELKLVWLREYRRMEMMGASEPDAQRSADLAVKQRQWEREQSAASLLR